MAADSDFDSWEFGRKSEAKGRLPFNTAEKSYFRGINQSDLNLQSSKKLHENDYDLLSRSSRSGVEFRFINPAIYAECFETDENCGDYLEKSTIHRKIKCGETALVDRLSIISISNGEESSSTIDIDGDHGPGTYRCLPSVNSETTNSSLNFDNQLFRPITRIERRCKISDDFQASGECRSTEDLCFMSTQRDARKSVQRCSLNGHGILQGSTTSLSTTNLSERQTLSGGPIAKQIAHAEWVREKERKALKIKEERRQCEQKKKVEEERIQRETEERERRERESFLRWAEKKKKEEAARKEAVERELEFQRRLKEVEDKATIAKTIYLRQWARKKEEEQKAYQKKQHLKQQQEEEEKKKRLEESVKAYERWREKSKDKPKPATQGLLPHQKAKPTFVNPAPWQQILDEEDKLDELFEEPSEDSNDRENTPKLGNDKIEVNKSRLSHE